ncbi:MAG: hypothetical protein HWE10_13995 [Gammaproteobacteria bacterium]|nr:hypothetical protein [Gammaproteobacteria bacterium]
MSLYTNLAVHQLILLELFSEILGEDHRTLFNKEKIKLKEFFDEENSGNHLPKGNI